MLAARNLEKLMEVEADLKAQYEAKLNTRSAELNAKSIELEEALRGGFSQHILENYPGFDRLRQSPEYAALLERIADAAD